MKGYNKMLQKIEPSKIICYSEPFDEMQGDIIYIDYDLSSWRHLNDIDKGYIKTTNKHLTDTSKYYTIEKIGYIRKGSGSAFGGTWKPKDENSKRFLGKPNSISKNHVTNPKSSYDTLELVFTSLARVFWNIFSRYLR